MPATLKAHYNELLMLLIIMSNIKSQLWGVQANHGGCKPTMRSARQLWGV